MGETGTVDDNGIALRVFTNLHNNILLYAKCVNPKYREIIQVSGIEPHHLTVGHLWSTFTKKGVLDAFGLELVASAGRHALELNGFANQ